jgi:FkbM family methyltransferase
MPAIRYAALRHLYSWPYFRGRDRLIGWIVETFASHPVSLLDGLLMELDPSEWNQVELIAKGELEPVTLKRIRALMGEGDVMIDVGAHIGLHALTAARAAPTGRVLAIDPQPYNIDRLARNASWNGLANVEGICAAAGVEDGFVRFLLQKPSDRSRLSLALANPNDLLVQIEVPMRRLDSILGAHRVSRVRLLKIDVEGFELEVLQGLGNRLGDCANVILEMLDDIPTERGTRVVQLLTSAGFALHNVEGRPWRAGEPLVENNLWAFIPSDSPPDETH